MGAFAELGKALAEGLSVRVAVRDPEGGAEMRGVLTRELSDTHVRLRADDGLVFAVAKTDLTFLPTEEQSS